MLLRLPVLEDRQPRFTHEPFQSNVHSNRSRPTFRLGDERNGDVLEGRRQRAQTFCDLDDAARHLQRPIREHGVVARMKPVERRRSFRAELKAGFPQIIGRELRQGRSTTIWFVAFPFRWLIGGVP